MVNSKNNSCHIPGIIIILGLFLTIGCGQELNTEELRQDFLDPPEEAKPWVFWYWMNAAVSSEGITADLEAMKDAGIGGAYLMPIRGAEDPPAFEPPAVQLTSRWWELVMHALNEADRVGLKIGMHASDGFALAGGPWITPELSMQKVVWTETLLEGGKELDIVLDQPEAMIDLNSGKDYYRDLAVFAYPSETGPAENSLAGDPEISNSLPGIQSSFLDSPDNNEVFRSQDSCWIQYAFNNPFTCRNITIRTRGFNYPSHRFWMQCSDNGKDFRTICRLEAPRHGWQEESTDVTHAIEPTRAKYFRFVYGRSGLEPGAEDLESAKWSPILKIAGIHLSGSPRIHQYRGKSAALWRISPSSKSNQLPDSLCIPANKLIDISKNMDAGGRLKWNAPEGNWTILRMGHTSTGKTNYTGGGGLGLECDKFNPEAAKLQFENWFGAVAEQAGPELADRVLKVFHVDSWECGSQNWSPVFREEFIKRRGYDPLPHLPVMAGIPVQTAAGSEKFLYDIRLTISELVIDNFYKVLAASAKTYGCSFSAECIAPTMTSDGMLHYKTVDLPMGEFWLNSPTHDKPNDMLDAISGAHVYGKQIIQAEAFTELSMRWDEHPGMLKALGDRSYTQGINRLAYHVFAHNPWMDRKPGMTLSRIGLYFQRDQIWWEPGKAWIDYTSRCQALLQKGVHVADIAVFTGEEIPRRAVLPDRLVSILPGIYGEDLVRKEKLRLQNAGVPRKEMPEGVFHSANMADPRDWTDPLRGYSYDSFNPDVLLNLATVKNGRIVLPGGASYGLLIIPAASRMNPDGNFISEELAEKILDLAVEGACILLEDTLRSSNGQFLPGDIYTGKGKVLSGQWMKHSFGDLGIEPDFMAFDLAGHRVDGLGWTHMNYNGTEIYFVSNQEDRSIDIQLSLRADGRHPDLYDPLSGEIIPARNWKMENGRTEIPLKLEANGSVFIVLERKTGKKEMNLGSNFPSPVQLQEIEGDWNVQFEPAFGGPDSSIVMRDLISWHLFDDPGIRYYSGTAIYRKTFTWIERDEVHQKYWLGMDEPHNMAEVYLNGKTCGVIWTEPYKIDISDRLLPGENKLEIHVSNTWANRLIGDNVLQEEERITYTKEAFSMEGRSLLEAGLSGGVGIFTE